MDREIKAGAKLEKRLIYLGFEEKNVTIEGVPVYKLEKRYFVHKSGLQVRVNQKEKTLTILDSHGRPLETKPVFLSSYLNKLIKNE